DDGELPLLSDSCVKCLVVRDKKTGSCKGFCFLEFLTLEAATAAVTLLSAGVQVAGAIVSAQLARQSGTVIKKGQDKHSKKVQARSQADRECLFDLRIQGQVYDKTGRNGPPPPLKRQGARIKPPPSSVQFARYTAQQQNSLCLTDAERLLRLQDEQQSLEDQQLCLEDEVAVLKQTP
ncbi:unnamed protein product, partial [Polarella glacialis]